MRAHSPIRRPARAPRRSIRPPRSCSRTSITPPRCSACRPSATSIRASAIRPARCWKSASPRSKAAPPGLAVASGHAAQVLVMHCLMKPGDEFVASKKLYGGSINQFNHAFKNFGWNVVWADPDDIEHLRARGDAEDQGDLHRVDREPRRRHHRHAGGRGDRQEGRRAATSSTTRWRRPTSASRSSTAPTSWCIRSPSFSAATATRSAA